VAAAAQRKADPVSPDPDYEPDTKRLYGTTDASVWAEEFCKRFDMDEGTMIAWFANAIEIGRSAGKAQREQEVDELTTELDIDAELLRAATDFAEFHGRSVEWALARIRNALVGEAEPLKALHVEALHYRDRIPVDTSRKARRKAAKIARRRNR
jgi:hypothetical protein